MSRYIDADKLKDIVNRQYTYCHGYTGTKKDIYREALLAVKSAIHCQSVSKDMQKIVRCKDCKYSKKGNVVLGVFDYECLKTGITCLDADDFCSYGERKDEE